MMATVPHVTSGLGLRKFQANGFLLTRVYHKNVVIIRCLSSNSVVYNKIINLIMTTVLFYVEA